MPVIVFDFFGVICSEIAPFVLPKYMSKEQAIAYKATIVRDADVGAITQDEMFRRLSKIANVPPEQLHEEFWSYVRIDPDMVALLEELRRHHRVALLTNALTPFFRQIAAKYDLERLFEIILVSSEVGLAKPDPAFFRMMVGKLGARPEDCIFIDDNADNLEGARIVGMNTLLFEGAEKLQRELARFTRS